MGILIALGSVVLGAGFVFWYFAESMQVRQVPGWAVVKAVKSRRLKRVGDRWVPYDGESQTEKESRDE